LANFRHQAIGNIEGEAASLVSAIEDIADMLLSSLAGMAVGSNTGAAAKAQGT